MGKWTRELITSRIREMHAAGTDLNYTVAMRLDVALLRAATRHYGSWRNAVQDAGFDYEGVRIYGLWSDERILATIREMHQRGEDLSWRHVSTAGNPRLAAAATKASHFGSWRAAVTAAGIEYASVRRYRRWDDGAIVRCIKERSAAGVDLNAKAVEESDAALITAARRRFGTWEAAVAAAGLDYASVALRKPYARRKQAASPTT